MDIQRLKDIRKELNVIQESCSDIYDNFRENYFDGLAGGKRFFIRFSENSYNFFLYDVCGVVGENLGKIEILLKEVKEGREIAISINNQEMLKEADGRISYCKRLHKYWKELIEEGYVVLEEARRRDVSEGRGFNKKIQVRTEPDDDFWNNGF